MSDRLEEVASVLISETGEDPAREGLVRTPQRFAKAYRQILSGYSKTVAEVVGEGVFKTTSVDPVIVARMKFYSLCEHHLLPFFGECSVGYVPRDTIIGLSKIPKLVDLFAKRLQVQEHLTQQIGEAIEQTIAPMGVVVLVKATHLCSVMRDIQDHDAPMITAYRRGVYSDNPTLFDEFRMMVMLGDETKK
jgi:GTP cyclohydrolase I